MTDLALTERECQVLVRIGRGMTNQEIAEDLYLSPNTVKTFIRGAYRKISVKSRSQAVLWAVTNLEAARPPYRLHPQGPAD